MNVITKIKFKNFYNFYEEQEIDFTLGKRCTRSNFDIDLQNGSRVSSILNILGHNGSGKTNLLKVLPFLKWFLNVSSELELDEEIIFSPFGNTDEPTTIMVDYVREGIEKRYFLKLTKSTIIEETISFKNPKTNKYSYYCKRTQNKKGHAVFKTKKPETNEVDTKVFKAISKNHSIFSVIKNWDNDNKKTDPTIPLIDFANVETNINYNGKTSITSQTLFRASKWYEENQDEFENAKSFMLSLDLGIDDISLEPIEYLDTDDKIQTKILAQFSHSSAVGNFELPILNESTGTRSIFSSLTHIFRALKIGGVAVIDELDNDLHVHMLKPLIELFSDKRINNNYAQLLFSCHSPEILNHLHKHQVYLVEKDQCMSQAWRLDTVEGLRADDNLYVKYLSGALGGTANI
jgi:AAA15 family ATPase/GTPase